MPNGTRRRKRTSQNGVQAIFTPANDLKGRIEIAAGGFTAGLGVLFWALSLRSLADATNVGILSRAANFSELFQPLAVVLVTSGIGLCTYSLAVRRARQDNYRIEAAVYELQTLVEGKTSLTPPTPEARPLGKSARTRGYQLHFPKFFVAALVEGVLLILAYSGLVQEYNSNLNMQRWVQANFGMAGYVLSYNSVLLLVAGLLGYLIFQLATRLNPFKVRQGNRTLP